MTTLLTLISLDITVHHAKHTDGTNREDGHTDSQLAGFDGIDAERSSSTYGR